MKVPEDTLSTVPGGPRPSRRWSLAARLTAWYACTAFMLVAGTSLFQYHTLSADLAAEDDRLVLETLAAAQRASVAAVPRARSTVEIQREGVVGPVVREFDAACSMMRDEWPPGSPPSHCRVDTPVADVTLWTWRSPAQRVWRLASGPVAGGGSVEVALDRWTDESVLADFREKLSVALVVALLLSAATGFTFARRGLAPLVDVAQRVGRIDARTLAQLLEPIPDAPAEVAALVASCNSMLLRLEGAFGALTHFRPRSRTTFGRRCM